jgi:hypothetical protein
METGKSTVPRCSRNREDWFKAKEKLLFAAIQARNKAFSELSTHSTNAAKKTTSGKHERT